MRITKVKVDGKSVVICRNTMKGSLTYVNDGKDYTHEILPEKKISNFRLSIQNQTIRKVKKRELGKDFPKELFNELTAYFDNLLKNLDNDIIINKPAIFYSKSVTPEHFMRVLGSKFTTDVTFTDSAGKSLTFNLIADIRDENNRFMSNYKKWAREYIGKKSKYLKKSIENNKLMFNSLAEAEDHELSNRKKVLKLWSEGLEGKLEKKNSVKLEALLLDILNEEKYAEDYDLADLIKNLIELCETTDDSIIDSWEFRKEVKRIQVAHRNKIFGKGNENYLANRSNRELQQYHEEVKKYLDRNFSLKNAPKNKKKQTEKEDTKIRNKETIKIILDKDTVKQTIANQITNAIRQHWISVGKATSYEYDQNTSGDALSRIKIQQAFMLKLIDACGFGINNIHNIINHQGVNEIVTTSDSIFKEQLESNRTLAGKNLKMYFPDFKGDSIELLWALRGSVALYRNHCIHFKQNALGQLHGSELKPTYSKCDKKNQAFSSSPLKQLLVKEKLELKERFAEKLKSGNILTYYHMDILTTLFGKHELKLSGSNIAFTPGFKNVYKAGCKYQNHLSGEYNLDTKYYVQKRKDESEEAYNARYNMFKILYNHFFISTFGEDTKSFCESVDQVLRINKEFALGSRNKKARAFEGMRVMEANETPHDYMRYIQSEWTQELAKKSDKKNNDAQDANIHFANFVLQIYTKGFDTFIEGLDCHRLLRPTCMMPADCVTEAQKASWLNDQEKTIAQVLRISAKHTNTDHEMQIAYYGFCKLLDANHLSGLRNELIKLRQADDKLRVGDINYYDYMQEIVEMCLLTADRVPSNYLAICQTPQEYLDRIKPFVEAGADLKQWGEVYFQSDNITPVVHAPLELAMKYGTANVLQKVIESDNKYRVLKSEFDTWKKLKTGIETKIARRDELHSMWSASKSLDQEKTNKLSESQEKKFARILFAEYKTICNEIDQYVWLDNKVHLQHLSRLHNLVIDLLGRLAGFVALWDRDFLMLDAQYSDEYQLIAFNGFSPDKLLNNLIYKEIKFRDRTGQDEEIFGTEEINALKEMEIKTRGEEKYSVKWKKDSGISLSEDNSISLSEVKEKLDVIRSSKRPYYKSIFFNDDDSGKTRNAVNIRNTIAHFNFLSKSLCLIDLINETRWLMGYDRKLKNAVAKSIIKIFEKHGMIITFEMKDHNLELGCIKPKKIRHLGGLIDKVSAEPIETDRVHQDFCEMCKALMTMNSK